MQSGLARAWVRGRDLGLPGEHIPVPGDQAGDRLDKRFVLGIQFFNFIDAELLSGEILQEARQVPRLAERFDHQPIKRGDRFDCLANSAVGRPIRINRTGKKSQPRCQKERRRAPNPEHAWRCAGIKFEWKQR